MKTIWKFPLSIKDHQKIEMPSGAQVLTVQTQGGMPCLWAIVDPVAVKEKFSFSTFGTGHAIPESYAGEYVGTYQLHGGAIVFHVFRG